MKREVDHESPSLAPTLRNAPYSSSLASSASASSQSVWSDTSSQSSDDSNYTNDTDDSCQSNLANSSAKFENPWTKQLLPSHTIVVPAALRQNPRRTSAGSLSRPRIPPALVRQCDRKLSFVDNLVDCSTQIVEAVWPLSSILCRNEMGDKAVLPLRTFIQETLRRSRTSYSTLQVALYYLVLIKPQIPKHDFTMEQSDDSPSCRALQCGRRMFLAALILASKYLQDRNYSARAWSKISGLNTLEINQNEIAFLNAVRWKLHITDEIFQRWTEIVLKHTPPSPPSSPAPACLAAYSKQCAEWKDIILKLNPDLENIESLFPNAFLPKKLVESCTPSPRIILQSPCGMAFDSELSPTPRAKFVGPMVMEPMPVSVHTPGRLAPALGLLPTPRLTPQTSGFNTPAVSAVSHLIGKNGAMGMAMAQSSNACASQLLDRWPSSTTSSPIAYFSHRRSSLVTNVSTASSPESMVSDSSRISRSSSISSACSVVSAVPNKLAAPARSRLAKLSGERSSLLTMIASVPEDYEACLTSSPETYTGPVGKLGELSLETPLARREMELAEGARDADAARALQKLQSYHDSAETTPKPRATLKRSRTCSNDNSLLQDHVREMLGSAATTAKDTSWSDKLVRSRSNVESEAARFGVRPSSIRPRKRVCCSTEAAQSLEPPARPMMGSVRGPGMWEGILN